VNADIVNLDPATVTVQNDLITLQSNYASGNQWYKDGVMISGATAQAYIPMQSGSYSVSVISSGCTTTSAPVSFVVTGIETSSDGSIRMYPNPVKTTLTIEIDGQGNASGELFNVLGQRLSAISFTSDGKTQTGKCDFTKSSEGVYLIRINQGNVVKLLRVVKE
jgi:hypothetical protein